MSTSTSTVAAVLRAGLREGRVMLQRKYLSAQGINLLVLPIIMTTILWFTRHSRMQDDLVSTGAYLLGGFLAFGIISAAIMGVAGDLQVAREDGTLLRAKAVPHGIAGHLVARAVGLPVDALLPILPLLLLGPVMLPGLLPDDPLRWVLLLAVYLLGTLALVPLGAILGSVFRSMVILGSVMLLSYVLAAISGLFFPLTVLPPWLQAVGQTTPLYWLGHLIRQILLPASAAAVEVGGVWRPGLAVLVLLGWALAGFLLAPVVLRRMARRQSGSVVQAARDRTLARGY